MDSRLQLHKMFDKLFLLEDRGHVTFHANVDFPLSRAILAFNNDPFNPPFISVLVFAMSLIQNAFENGIMMKRDEQSSGTNV
ncbi:hypothetical protein DICVIV_02879 [Dictyocaulus viviparus]|uniref:Uncharacterized protein n=1 Tax=Dictyocaulus viviparus TaxID=29172 RepID=A0A0D8Y232_DICVI|nr:hypothetical protein DICVIV_02879 [Dictyocaulus viviparus]